MADDGDDDDDDDDAAVGVRCCACSIRSQISTAAVAAAGPRTRCSGTMTCGIRTQPLSLLKFTDASCYWVCWNV